MPRMEENNEVRAIVDMILPGKRPRGRLDGLGPKEHAGTADYPGQNILEIKNAGPT